MPGDIFGCHKGGQGCCYTSTMCRNASTIKNHLLQNVTCAKVKKPWLRYNGGGSHCICFRAGQGVRLFLQWPGDDVNFSVADSGSGSQRLLSEILHRLLEGGGELPRRLESPLLPKTQASLRPSVQASSPRWSHVSLRITAFRY